jgi:hypothetical protein
MSGYPELAEFVTRPARHKLVSADLKVLRRRGPGSVKLLAELVGVSTRTVERWSARTAALHPGNINSQQLIEIGLELDPHIVVRILKEDAAQYQALIDELSSTTQGGL